MELSAVQLQAITGQTDLVFEGTTGEQRKAPRLPLRCRAAIQPIRNGALGPVESITVRDISESGFGFVHGGKLKIGEVFVLHLPCKTGGVLKLWCVAKRVEPGRRGSSHVAIGAAFHRLFDAEPAKPAESRPPMDDDTLASEVARIRQAVLSDK